MFSSVVCPNVMSKLAGVVCTEFQGIGFSGKKVGIVGFPDSYSSISSSLILQYLGVV
jgi:hypothetical protein